jgi:hypothetical protein
MAGAPDWPEWWDWPLEFTPHLYRRMRDRGFDEIDLRTMLQAAKTLTPNHEEGRWAVYANHVGRDWEIVVEPDPVEERLVVITAYPVD